MKVKLCRETLKQEGWSAIYPDVPRYGTVHYVEAYVTPLARYLLDNKRIHKLLMSALLIPFKRALKKNKPTAEITYAYAGPMYDINKGNKYINQYIIVEYYMYDSEDSRVRFREDVWFEVHA